MKRYKITTRNHLNEEAEIYVNAPSSGEAVAIALRVVSGLYQVIGVNFEDFVVDRVGYDQLSALG